MVLKSGEVLRCPRCGGKEFCSTAHVTQDWELDDSGNFVKSLNDCVEVTHFPDSEDIWDCKSCGYSAAGSTFIVKERGTNDAENKMSISRMGESTNGMLE